MITALYFFASLQNASVDGPGIVSASAKKRWSSTWQKYCDVNSSCVQKILAPCFSACSASASWFARLRFGSSPQVICDSPTLTTVDGVLKILTENRRYFCYLPCCIAERNSLFVLVLLIFESSNSIASTADSGVSTRRST